MKLKLSLALAALGLSASAALSVAGNSTKLIDKDVSNTWIKTTDAITCEDWKSWEGVDTATVRLELAKVPENSWLSILGVESVAADLAGKTCADVKTAELVGPAEDGNANVELTRVVNKVIHVNTYMGCTDRLLQEDLSIKLHSGLVLTGRSSRTLGSKCKLWN